MHAPFGQEYGGGAVLCQPLRLTTNMIITDRRGACVPKDPLGVCVTARMMGVPLRWLDPWNQ
jgi:hypothetical protein